MRIALINPPYFNPRFMENIGFVEKHLRILPPLSLMYVSSIAKSHGHETIIIDAVAEHLSKRKVAKKLREFKPDIIGFPILVPASSILFEWIRYLKEKFYVPVVVGGNALLYYPEAILSKNFIDYAVVGSAANAFPELLEALEKECDMSGIEGIAFKKGGKVVVNHPASIKKDMDSIPFPDREGVNNFLYASIASSNRPYTIMMTSSGCIYKCDFCPMGRMEYEERDADNVIREIEECVRKYGIKEIDIQDENFLLKKERAKEILKEIIRRKINASFSCRARVDDVDKEILEMMKRAGFRLIMYGIESGNDDILKREHKGIRKEQIKKAIELTKNAEIKTLGFFIIGHKGESKETIRETIMFMRELPLDYVQFFHMVVKPGTEVYDEMKKDMGYDYFDAVLRGNIKERYILLPWTKLSNREINRWILRAYFSFYFRKGHINKILKIPAQWIKLLVSSMTNKQMT